MTKVAVLDDWQGVARASADWSPLQARAEVVFFANAFDNEDDAAHSSPTSTSSCRCASAPRCRRR